MSVSEWPDWIVPNSIDWWLETQSRSGGQSILGAERIVSSPAARWRCMMTFRVWGTLTDPKRLLFWRSLAGRLYGRSGACRIGPFDQMTPERLAGGVSTAAALHSDTATLSGGAGYAQPTGRGFAAAAAASGARQIVIAYVGAGTPQAGQYFGIGGASLYLADYCVDNGGGTFTLMFSPGLRAALAQGDEIEFERPRATMRLLADDGARAKLMIGGVADTTLDLVEVF